MAFKFQIKARFTDAVLFEAFSVEEFRDLMKQGAAALQAVSEKEVA